jgi:hypothetical protein
LSTLTTYKPCHNEGTRSIFERCSKRTTVQMEGRRHCITSASHL